MSVYLVKKKGWRYDFTQNGKRYTASWFKAKREAKKAEAKRREEVEKQTLCPTPTVLGFLELVNLRLDHVKSYNSARHYQGYVYLAKRWVKEWGELNCDQLNQAMIEKFILKRSKVSHYTANKEIRNLRATFNFGIKKKLITENPVNGIDFLPVEKRIKYVPSAEDIDKVIAVAEPDDQDYLWVIRETMARVSEINRLTWDDVDFINRQVVLYTRKKKGGHLTPRKIPMTLKLYEVLYSRYESRDNGKPWVFWHRYWSTKEQSWKEGSYEDRKRFMRTLCRKAEVRYFRFHALRHAGASIMENSNIPVGVIQKVLGHESRTTTEIYLHNLGGIEREAMTIYELARQSHTDSHMKKGVTA